jgi:hypothetical protein
MSMVDGTIVKPGPAESCATPSALSPTSERATLIRQAFRLEWMTVAWMVIEGVVALGAGLAAGSLTLMAFGLDSAIELASVCNCDMDKGFLSAPNEHRHDQTERSGKLLNQAASDIARGKNRPVGGSRNLLGEAMITDLYKDWCAHGIDVIRQVREDDPVSYLKVVALLVSKIDDAANSRILNAVNVAEIEKVIEQRRQQALLTIAKMREEPAPGDAAGKP